MIRLTAQDTVLDINPELAASMWRFTDKGRDVLRPTPDGSTDTLDTGNFPLVPWCNRIRDGAFVFEGHKVKLPPNFGDSPHTLHGHGWRAAWTVIEASPTRAVLSFRHTADAWPWDYEATVVYELRPGGVRCFLTIKNLSKGVMPAGLGFHPYFLRTPDTRLKASVDGVWLVDDQTLPRNWHAGVVRKDWTNGDRVSHDITIDNCYTGFKGKAEIFEGDRLTHTLRASPNCRWLHIFAPTHDQGYFCAEPVDHMPDPFNQPNSGLHCLKAGATDMVWMDIAVHG